ncbi:ABC transporter substrate-binding protein [Oceanicella actignis]|uniref:ABC transporter substrate-binding protein n=1 Tax=Oceanicella actignis TaxID=1189325 RepID=UPI0011E7FBF4|nr:ABC transporter substrate-binding protein [Oceanicella actignis]TYO88256.1 branched-chain amino acid transport system substrate-binding protein [Oceanicella actignis]
MYRALTVSLALALGCVSAARADIVLADLSYRTGPYANNGIPSSDGFNDYITLLNERDGGIEGEKIRVVPCEFGYNTQKGVECYDKMKAAGALSIQPLSTGVTYGIIPKSMADGIPVLTTGYGRTSAADGEVFSTIFNPPANYWQAADAQIRFIKEQEGSLRGKKIALVYHNSPYGKEPIPTLEALARREGFELQFYPIDHPGAEQAADWDKLKAAAPDWVLLWGWGVMNPTALREARRVKFPIDHIIGVWWSANETDVKSIGRRANGYKAVNFHAVGTEFRIYNDMNEYVYFAGKARGEADNLGTVLYNRGILTAILVTEAARTAMKIHGTTKLTPQMMRDGFENLNITEERMAEIGMEGFVPPFSLSCANHGGSGRVTVNEWDARLRGWRQIADYYEPDMSIIGPMIKADADKFAKENGIKRRKCR